MQAALHSYKNLYHFHNHFPLTTPATMEDMDFKNGPSRLVRVQRLIENNIVKFGTWYFRLGITRYTTLPLSKNLGFAGSGLRLRVGSCTELHTFRSTYNIGIPNQAPW